jgi:hypothetical protein
MVDDLDRVKDMLFQGDQDLRQVIHQVRDQSAHTPLNAINECVGNRSPKELLLGSLRQVDGVLQSESLVRDRA